ncbi:MAG: hypothetical protein KDD34_08000 [Bdellovibrionales bacterium]|nr:hypothetical protein [Bdellovibrionales bacterium]
MEASLKQYQKLNWFFSDNIRPYVFVREENRIKDPGTKFDINWFNRKPIYRNPLLMSNVEFADQILSLEEKAFSTSNMAMPRWVFFDCAIMPGFVAGYAIHKDAASEDLKRLTRTTQEAEWIPLSLFIIIPTMGDGEWVAHNLCSANSLLPKEQRFYGLGFLTKAFGLWYANIEICCGMTQWRSPAARLHTHYGDFEVLTAYTPVHSYSQTLTYRLRTDPKEWERFFSQEPSMDFSVKYKKAGFQVNPSDELSLKAFQLKIEMKQGPFFLDSNQIRKQALDAPLDVFVEK